MNKLRNEVYMEGYDAAKNGVPSEENPYDLHHERDWSELDMWWTDGYADFEEGNPPKLYEE